MSAQLWGEIEGYLDGIYLPHDPVLEAVLTRNAAAGLPPIAVPPSQGKLLMLMARMMGARRILEIGTLGGYSTIWLARGLPPDGLLVTLEANPAYAEIARANIAAADLGAVVEVRVGPALQSLPLIAAEAAKPFDLIFIDANKDNNAEYIEWAFKLSRPGTAIVVDNIVRDGRIIDLADTSAQLEGIRRGHLRLAAEPHVQATALQMVSGKGHDGFAVALVGVAPA